VPLRKTEIILAHVLAEHGYQSGSAGKLHFEPQRGPQNLLRLPRGSSYYSFREVHLSENTPGTGRFTRSALKPAGSGSGNVRFR
jgi:arylsulfatase A-like enzyme